MKVVPRKMAVIIKRGRLKHGEMQKHIQSFICSGSRFCRIQFVIGKDYTTLHCADNAIRNAVKISGENIKVHLRGDRIYLEKMF